MKIKNKKLIVQFVRPILYIVAFICGWLFGSILLEELKNQSNDPSTPDVSATITEPELVFKTLDTECIGIPEVTKGRVWLCDNGHIEYDSTNVRFPSLDEVENVKEEERNEQ